VAGMPIIQGKTPVFGVPKRKIIVQKCPQQAY
jgi:hypothetical protein